MGIQLFTYFQASLVKNKQQQQPWTWAVHLGSAGPHHPEPPKSHRDLLATLYLRERRHAFPEPKVRENNVWWAESCPPKYMGGGPSLQYLRL